MLAGRKTTITSELNYFYPNYKETHPQVPDITTRNYGIMELTFLNFEDVVIQTYSKMFSAIDGKEYNRLSYQLLRIHRLKPGMLWNNQSGELIELERYDKQTLESLHLKTDRKICTIVLNLAISDDNNTRSLQREWIEEYKLKLKRIEELCNTLEGQKYMQETEHQQYS
jgi:hypothetical protein